jgi:formate dehydrogenase maturation protein FdhE
MKQCATCGELKDESEYNWRNTKKGIRWGTCKACQSKQRLKWYNKHKDRHIQKVRERKKRVVQETQQYVTQVATLTDS